MRSLVRSVILHGEAESAYIHVPYVEYLLAAFLFLVGFLYPEYSREVVCAFPGLERVVFYHEIHRAVFHVCPGQAYAFSRDKPFEGEVR